MSFPVHGASLNKIVHSPQKRRRLELQAWLGEKFDFTHFVTLTTNDPTFRPDTMRKRLKEWDARVNRKLYGPKWKEHADELIWYFAFLEKPVANPHWHLLLRIVGKFGSDLSEESTGLSEFATTAWKQVVASGTADVQEIHPGTYKTVAEYVAKELPGELQYDCFLTPDQFRRF